MTSIVSIYDQFFSTFPFTMISTTATFTKPSVPLTPGTRRRTPWPLQPTVEESILEINNDGVSLLQAGNNKAAMIRLARCLALMRSRAIEGDAEVHYKFTTPLHYTLPETSNSSSRYLFAAPLVVSCPHAHGCGCCDSKDEEPMICKLLSLILFNLSLAHHLCALELLDTIKNNAHDEAQRRQEVFDLLEKSLRLYELCHSSLVFTNSGLLCSDLSVAVVVTNNVGEIHKQLHEYRVQNQHEHRRTAMACSEQLLQIFMFFSANGAPKRLEGFGDVLSNAMATLNGPQTVAPAA